MYLLTQRVGRLPLALAAALYLTLGGCATTRTDTVRIER